jgi:hypothetical protein
MAAEQNKRGNIPAHDEYADGHAYKNACYGIYVSQVFGRQVQRVGAEAFHEGAIDRAEQDKPEYEQHLEFFQVKQHQLYGK